jgi:S-adenosylmethionine/arginine decarboxylase-like enzyme
MASVKHLKVLGRKADPVFLGNATRMKELVEGLIHCVGMQLLGEVQVHDVELDISKLGREPFEDEGGISVLGCLSTSHVALHGWPLRREYHLDIYSCRAFESATVIEILRDELRGDLQVTDLTHALAWSREHVSGEGDGV